MDMNFPHQTLERTADDEGTGMRAPSVDQQAMLRRAIARQASSPSAQDFFVASRDLETTRKAARSSFMDDRMAFFAGRSRSNMSGRRETILFRTGCFRPDLAQREIDIMNR
jgi:hypothetical protein